MQWKDNVWIEFGLVYKKVLSQIITEILVACMGVYRKMDVYLVGVIGFLVLVVIK